MQRNGLKSARLVEFLRFHHANLWEISKRINSDATLVGAPATGGVRGPRDEEP